MVLLIEFLEKLASHGFEANIVTYGIVIKGLCRIGDNAGALNLLKKMQSGPCKL